MASLIRWSRSDYARLRGAVNQFNRKINELKTEENKLYLPDTINYQEAKENITTRSELDRTINSLKRFQRKGAESLYVTEAGQQMTKWERRELGIQKQIASRRLRAELSSLSLPMKGSNYSRIQMGSERAREIQKQLENLNKIETTKGFDFNLTKLRIMKAGVSDYEMKKAITYRENYLQELEKYKNFQNYEKLEEKLKSITNPVAFYDFMSNTELTKDLTYQSDQAYTQEEFNRFLNDLGIETEDVALSPEDLERQQQYEMDVQEYQRQKIEKRLEGR